jgi:hypothetical protein
LASSSRDLEFLCRRLPARIKVVAIAVVKVPSFKKVLIILDQK